MWAMAQNSMILFFRGKLFADSGKAYRQLAVGILFAAVLFVVVAKVGPLWLAGLFAGLAGGALQPVLFKDLRYR